MDNEKDKDSPYRLFVILAVSALAVWAIGAYFAYGREGESIFDGISALFSGLAFAGMFCALVMQKHELSLQRQELADTRAELAETKEATQKFADAMAYSARLEAFNGAIAQQTARIEHLSTLIKENLPRTLSGSADSVAQACNRTKNLERQLSEAYLKRETIWNHFTTIFDAEEESPEK